MQNKHKLKRFLAMLKNAQNEVFIGLVIGNITAELSTSYGLRADKVFKITDILLEGVLNCTDKQIKFREFCRLNFTKSLITLLAKKCSKLFFDNYVKTAVSILNNSEIKNNKPRCVLFEQKHSNKLLFKLSDIEPSVKDNQSVFNLINLRQVLSRDEHLSPNRSSNIETLMCEYKELLRDLMKDDDKKELTKDAIIDQIHRTGAGETLTQFIDKKFLDDCLAQPVIPTKGDNRKHLQIYMNTLQELNSTLAVSQLGDNKRQRVEETKEKGEYLLLSPQMAILLHYAKKLTADQWEVRQVAAKGLTALLSQPVTCQYAFLKKEDSKFSLLSEHEVDSKLLFGDTLARAVIQMMRDQFKDNEDITVKAPVRKEGMDLIEALSAYIPAEMQMLIDNTPQLLAVCEVDWQAKQSFFMILKGMISLRGPPYQKLFAIIGQRVLIECITKVEDSVKIVLTQLIGEFLDLYMLQQNLVIDILNNLTAALASSDDIEGSCIQVFDLFSHILAHKEFKSQYQLNCKILFAFNFHHVKRVRKTFHVMLNLALKSEYIQIQEQDLLDLHTLLCQSIIMEDDIELVKVLKSNLNLVVSQLTEIDKTKYVKFLSENLLMPQRMQSWLIEYKIPDFEHFLFFEAPCFEPIQKDYFKIVHEPVGQQELNPFYDKVLESCLSILVIISDKADLEGYIQQVLQMKCKPTLVNKHRIVLYKFKEKLSRIDRQQLIDSSCCEAFNQNLMVATPERVSIQDYQQLNKLFENFQMAIYELQQVMQPTFQWLMNWLNHSFQAVSNSLNLINQPDSIPNQDLLEHMRSVQMCQQHLFELQQYLSPKIVTLVQQCIDNLVFLQRFIQQQSDLMKALLVSQHCREVLRQQSQVDLNKKLDEIIQPVWFQLIEQSGETQKIIARIVSNDLMPAVGKVGKIKQRDKIIKLILNQLAKETLVLEEFIQDSELEKMIDPHKIILETNKKTDQKTVGCELVLETWMQNRYDFFRVYDSDAIINVLDLDNNKPETIQDFINLTSLILGQFLRLNQKGQTITDHFKDVIVRLLGKVVRILQLPDHYMQLDCLVQRLYCFFELEKLTDQRFLLITQLLAQLQEGKHFSILQRLIRTCVNQRPVSVEAGLTSYLTNYKPTQQYLCPLELHNSFIELYCPLFILPVIKFMSQSKGHIACLGQLLQILPGAKSDYIDQMPDTEAWLKDVVKESSEFLAFFTQAKMQSKFKFVVEPQATLREYQKCGIEWLIRLGRYGLNCALCDDMGLGKTIQSLAVIINETKEQKIKGKRKLSLVVCPNTLTHQWEREITKFFSHENIKAMVYDSSTKQKIWSQIDKMDIIIVSYDRARMDILSGMEKSLLNEQYFYLVLDEGHRIKSSKSKVTLALKSLSAERKLILSGTPLQNQVSELWSIFDFLMPNFLEDEKVFNSSYSQYLTSGIAKISENLEETQSFLNALKSLKKRIQPFILRRTKMDVLKDLPPKQIQDYECDMTPNQKIFHQMIEEQYPITGVTEDYSEKVKGQQVFKNLILHRKVINHPELADEGIRVRLDNKSKKIYDKICQPENCQEASAKLRGLVQLLRECGIIDDNDETQNKKEKQEATDLLQTFEDDQIQTIEPHRALIFCQMTSYLDMVRDYILKPYGVKFTQLLSKLSGRERIDVCENFNSDNSIRVLLMTTAVGGLGLNLTGADTVIFMEHDWNPMKDVQAIDRAHRIGQTRRVNVYRLIVKDSLEEKIMGLQRFKKNLQKCLIQAQSAGGDGALSEDAQIQIHDLIQSFEDHKAIQQSSVDHTKGLREDVIGVENLTDKVYDAVEGDFTSTYLEKL